MAEVRRESIQTLKGNRRLEEFGGEGGTSSSLANLALLSPAVRIPSMFVISSEERKAAE